MVTEVLEEAFGNLAVGICVQLHPVQSHRKCLSNIQQLSSTLIFRAIPTRIGLASAESQVPGGKSKPISSPEGFCGHRLAFVVAAFFSFVHCCVELFECAWPSPKTDVAHENGQHSRRSCPSTASSHHAERRSQE